LNGIKLELSDDGDVEVFEEKPTGPLCWGKACDYAQPDHICMSTGGPIIDIYHDPGWCPLSKWYLGSKAKEFDKWYRIKFQKANS
jgi:hypothetical protein